MSSLNSPIFHEPLVAQLMEHWINGDQDASPDTMQAVRIDELDRGHSLDHYGFGFRHIAELPRPEQSPWWMESGPVRALAGRMLLVAIPHTAIASDADVVAAVFAFKGVEPPYPRPGDRFA